METPDANRINVLMIGTLKKSKNCKCVKGQQIPISIEGDRKK